MLGQKHLVDLWELDTGELNRLCETKVKDKQINPHSKGMEFASYNMNRYAHLIV